MATFTGTSNNDTLTGTAADDLIDGLGGNDSLIGLEGNDSLDGGSGNDTLNGGSGNDTLNGGTGGFDVANYSGASGPLTVNLATGTKTGGDGSIDTLLNIEQVRGGTFNDVLTGDGNNNLLRGNLGDDTLDGGAGTDTADYSQASGSVTVNLATGTASGADGNDTLVSIESVFGTAGNDSFTGGDPEHAPDALGNSTAENFRPSGGNDTITGGIGYGVSTRVDYANSTNAITVNLGTGIASDGFGGTDVLVRVDQVFGGSGNDVLYGGSLERSSTGDFFEVFRGNAGNDTIDGAGTDTVLGAGGTNRANYANSPAAIIVNLGTTPYVVGNDTVPGGAARDGFGFTDTLRNIDQVQGSAFNDRLVGGADDHRLIGEAGNDTLVGAAYGVEASYQNATAAAIANLATGTASDGQGGTDTLINITDLRGSDFNDTLIGNDADNRLTGLDGADTIDGGAGIDFAGYNGTTYALGGVNVFIENGGGLVVDAWGSTDTLINIEGLIGSNSNDTLAGELGDQWFIGRGGSDTLNGGANSDWVSYTEDPAGVTVNLGTGTATDGWGGIWGWQGTDTLISIENVEGSDFADTLIGDEGANELRGGEGNDTLDGGTGVDTAVYSGARAGYTVTSTASGYTVSGSEGTDTLSNIESAQFSDMTLALDAGAGGAAGNTLIVETSDEILSFARVVSATNPIVGSWYRTGPSSPGNAGGTTVITFLADGTYLLSEDGDSLADPTGQDGMERGTYTWDSSTGAFTSITTVDTNGQWGLSHPQGSLNIQVNGDTGTITSLEGSFSFSRVADAANPIVGGWNFTGDANDRVALTFFADGTYMLAEDKVIAEPGGQDGMERGTYTWNASTGAFTSITTVDTNGEWGISHSVINRVTVASSGTGDPILGTGGDDTLAGGSDNDFIFSGGGNDTLNGGAGNDTLDGGTGDDRMAGGSGDDTYYVDSAGDVVQETDNSPALSLASTAAESAALGFESAALEGITDTVIAAVNYSLTVFVENLTLASGSAAATGTGNLEDNVLTGNALNNTLTGVAGNDTIDGGAGVDTSVYNGARAGYTVTPTASGYTVSGSEGTDTLSNIERVQFSDQSLALDMTVSEAGGKTALLLGACLGKDGLNDQATVGEVLDFFDGGYTLTDAATLLVGAGIVARLAGGADNQHFVDWIYLNVVEVLPDPSTEATLISFITSGQYTQATFLATVAGLQINQDYIGLVGFQQDGMDFI